MERARPRDLARPATKRRPRNVLLAALTDTALAELEAQSVQLAAGQVLSQPGSPLTAVWLPETCLLATMVEMSDGRSVAPGFVTYHGYAAPAVEGSIFADDTAFACLIAGEAWRVPIDCWEGQVAGDPFWRAAVARADRRSMRQLLLLSACARLHPLRARTATMLLRIGEKVGAAEIPMTHDVLAVVLGVQRPSLSVVLERMAEQGSIKINHGRLSIVDRFRLEASACECYTAAADLDSTSGGAKSVL